MGREQEARLVEFDCEESIPLTAMPATPRPTGRPRQSLPSAADGESEFQSFDCELVPPPSE